MLHIRNTYLHKHKYLENGTLSRLQTFTIVFYERFYIYNTYRYWKKLPFTHGTGGCRKSNFLQLSLFLSGLPGQTRCHIYFMLHFLYQSVALLAGHFCDTLVLSQTQKLSSKATELTTAICLIQTRLVSQATPSWDWGRGHVVKHAAVFVVFVCTK